MISALLALALLQDVAVRGALVHTVSGAPIQDGVVLVQGGRITAVGPAAGIAIPAGVEVLSAAVVTPGLIDAHATAGLTGILNIDHDQDVLEKSAPMQPELRAFDAYNPREELVAWLRSFGITTLHTGHGPGALVSGQTSIVKTRGETIEECLVKPAAMLAVTLGDGARAEGSDESKSPGTRAKAVALLRQELIKAQEYRTKLGGDDPEKKPERDLHLETLVDVLEGELPLLITCHRQQDILAALRLREEFGVRVVLDGASEAYEVTEQILAAGVPVIVHPPMMRPFGIWDSREGENATFELAGRLKQAGIPIAFQSGFEGYVPKTRVVLLEAAIATRWGLSREQALAALTLDAARLLGLQDRLGSLEAGKDGDLALYDGDPFEYTSHCVGVVIDGRVVSRTVR